MARLTRSFAPVRPAWRLFDRLALLLTAIYIALFPGATLTVALDRVPTWGVAFGGVLLVLQGAAALCWLIGRAGWRGLFTGVGVGALAFAVEFAGETTGFPFGRYTYTDVLQPQLGGVVPLAICCAWVMVVASSLAIARSVTPPHWGQRAPLLLAATLVLLLDLQIETVATRINRYWVWLDTGWYYGVPTANFVAWWLVGLGLVWLVSGQWSGVSGQWSVVSGQWSVVSGQWSVATDNQQRTTDNGSSPAHPLTRSPAHPLTLSRYVPHALYALSTLMFAVTNLAHGFVLAGLVGVAVLAAGALWLCWSQRGTLWLRRLGGAAQRYDAGSLD